MKASIAKTVDLNRLVKRLSPQKRQELLDYAQFLQWQSQQRQRELVSFDTWALNLAKKRGFDKLTEEEVLAIVQECRRAA